MKVQELSRSPKLGVRHPLLLTGDGSTIRKTMNRSLIEYNMFVNI